MGGGGGNDSGCFGGGDDGGGGDDDGGGCDGGVAVTSRSGGGGSFDATSGSWTGTTWSSSAGGDVLGSTGSANNGTELSVSWNVSSPIRGFYVCHKSMKKHPAQTNIILNNRVEPPRPLRSYVWPMVNDLERLGGHRTDHDGNQYRGQ